jgi:hypothetical protein
MTASVGKNEKTNRSLATGLEKRLLAYAVSATAAGVGVLSLTQPADAKVIFTPSHQTILPNQTLKLDLDNDGVSEFSLKIFNSHLDGGVYATGKNQSKGRLYLVGAVPSEEAVKAASILGFVDALGSNANVGGSDNFFAGNMAYCLITNGGSPAIEGPWVKQKNKFLGVKFVIRGQTHYGWVRLSVKQMGTRLCEWEGLVTGYAYESTPNASILTGQKTGAGEVGEVFPDLNQPAVRATPSLGLLARGAQALDVWRREDEPAA